MAVPVLRYKSSIDSIPAETEIEGTARKWGEPSSGLFKINVG